ncbi:transposase family protein [Candidatus Azambacteria bacterium]|nr:transposase family protein [Candidatus Azambacteria bacterium]
MKIHKSTRLLPAQRKEIAARYFQKGVRIATLSRDYRVSRNSIYNILNRARSNDFSIHPSTNKRYRCLAYGLKRLAKVEAELERRLKLQAKRYNKSYPGAMLHSDTALLPILDGETALAKRETLYVAIDDFSRELYAAITPDRTQYASASFLKQVLEECPYTIEWYTDNGTEYKGNPKEHEFMKLCAEHGIKQSHTRPKTPRTNGKAERVIKTLKQMWHEKTRFKSRAHRKQELVRFVNYYNTVKPHKGINNLTPMEQLINYFYPQKL